MIASPRDAAPECQKASIGARKWPVHRPIGADDEVPTHRFRRIHVRRPALFSAFTTTTARLSADQSPI